MFPSGLLLWLAAATAASLCPSLAAKMGANRELLVPKALEMHKYMNLTIDPCENFYEFACGNWSHFQRQLQPGETVTVQSLMEEEVFRQLSALLERPTHKPDEPASVHKVRNFFRACLAEPNEPHAQHLAVLDFCKRYRGLPSVPQSGWQDNYNWVQVLGELRHDFGMDILIGLEIDTNLHTMQGNTIFLSEPRSTLLPPELCSSAATSLYDISDRAYSDIARQVAGNVRQWFALTEDRARRFGTEIVRYEFELCKGMRREEPLPSLHNDAAAAAADETDESELSGTVPQQHYGGGRRGRMPRAVLQRTGLNRVNGGNHRHSPYPRMHLHQFTLFFGGIIDFRQFVDRSLNHTINVPVYMRSKAYFQHLTHTIKLGSNASLANYIMYRAIAELIPPGDSAQQPRWKHCVALVRHHFPKILGEIYTNRYHRSEVRSELELLFNEIGHAFTTRLDVDWLDKQAQRAALQRLPHLKIGFPLYQNLGLDDLPVDRVNGYWRKLELVMAHSARKERERLHSPDSVDSWRLDGIEAPDVNVQLLPAMSVILAGWGLLQTPLYHYSFPNALKYSLVGQRIARELLTAFDEQGWNQNPLSAMRWDAYTTESFRNRTECFRAQYSNYLHNRPLVFRNATALRAIVADAGGLNVAFDAYLAWLEGMDLSQRETLAWETLPDLNYTNTQLFFIGFAQMRCSATFTQDAPPPDFLPLASHTPQRYAVNGPLSNNPEFAREFGCRIGSAMNPGDKCAVY